MWDLYLLLKDFNTEHVAVNFDIGHATVEGGYGGWIHSTRLLLPYMWGAGIKDFRWKREAGGKWTPAWCPLGNGMVQLSRFLSLARTGGFSGPVQIHMEHPELGGADTGARELTIPRNRLLAMMRRDLEAFARARREGGWS